jgi:hypothetical protein
MRDFFAFRKMITPAVIQIIFWLGVSICVVTGIGLISSSFHSPLFSQAKFITGLLMVIVGPIVIRIVCELQIVIFRIGDTLIEIRNNIVANGGLINNSSTAEPSVGEFSTRSSEPESSRGEAKPESCEPGSTRAETKIKSSKLSFKTKEEYEKWKAERMKEGEK